MLTTLREIINTMEGTVRVSDANDRKMLKALKGRDYLHQLIIEIKEDFMYDHLDFEVDYYAKTGKLHRYIDSLTDYHTEQGTRIERAYQQDWSIRIEDTLQEVIQGIEYRYSLHQGNLSHYFRFAF